MTWILLGLFLNFAGTILVAFSIIAGTIKIYDDKRNMLEHKVPIFKKWKFRVGVSLIAIGFVLQIIGVLS